MWIRKYFKFSIYKALLNKLWNCLTSTSALAKNFKALELNKVSRNYTAKLLYEWDSKMCNE